MARTDGVQPPKDPGNVAPAWIATAAAIHAQSNAQSPKSVAPPGGIQPEGDPVDRAGLVVAFVLGELEDMLHGKRKASLLDLAGIKTTLELASLILQGRA